MRSMTTVLSAIALFGLFLTGCDRSTDATDNTIVYEDAAESISAAVGDESGGATETLADVSIAGGGGALGTAMPVMSGDGAMVSATTPVYDDITGWWSVSVNRSKDNYLVSRSITREYRYQFQKNGVVQKFAVTGSDTATTLKARIVSGTGFFVGPRVSHALLSLKGAWTVSNINKDTVTVTIDSAYVRSGTDTIVTRNMKRTHTSTFTISSMAVKALRYRNSWGTIPAASWRTNFSKTISGTISGHYTAAITFQRGDLYKERNIDRDFSMTVGGGDGSLSINGNKGSFAVDVQNGQRK